MREHVSQSAGMQRVDQLNSALDPPAFGRRKVAPSRGPCSSVIVGDSFVFIFSLDFCPNGFHVLKLPRILDLFFSFPLNTFVFVFLVEELLFPVSLLVVFPAFM